MRPYPPKRKSPKVAKKWDLKGKTRRVIVAKPALISRLVNATRHATRLVKRTWKKRQEKSKRRQLKKGETEEVLLEARSAQPKKTESGRKKCDRETGFSHLTKSGKVNAKRRDLGRGLTRTVARRGASVGKNNLGRQAKFRKRPESPTKRKVFGGRHRKRGGSAEGGQQDQGESILSGDKKKRGKETHA